MSSTLMTNTLCQPLEIEQLRYNLLKSMFQASPSLFNTLKKSLRLGSINFVQRADGAMSLFITT